MFGKDRADRGSGGVVAVGPKMRVGVQRRLRTGMSKTRLHDLHVLAAWERANGMTPLDWQAIGDAERADDA
jgi:hypothetical protein